MSLFKGPFKVKINNELLADVSNFFYDTEDKKLRLTVVGIHPEQMNKILDDKKYISVVSFLACPETRGLYFIVEETSCKITTEDRALIVVQMSMKVKSAKFDKV